jgi:hypothetical protein
VKIETEACGRIRRRGQRPPGADGVQRAEVQPEHLPVEEEKGAEGLGLGRGRHVSLDRQVGEEVFYLGTAEGGGVAESFGRPVEADVLFNPADVAAFRFQGQAAETGDVADFIEQLHGGFLPAGADYPGRGHG